MRKPRILLNYTRMSDPALKLKAETIHTAMTGNVNFTTPSPTLASLLASVDQYGAALIAAQMGDKTKIAIKNSLKEELVQTLTELNSYVTYTAEGEADKLVSSGFTVNQSEVPVPPVATPQDMQALVGLNPGEVITSVEAVPGARSYLHQ